METASPPALPGPTSVTLDTNALSGVVDPDRWEGKPEYCDYCAIHAAVKRGSVRAFFSEAVVAIDAIARADKVETIGAARIISQATSTGANQITVSIGPRWQRPIIHEQFLARICSAQKLGMRALIGPRRFGDSVIAKGFGDDFYEPYPSGAAFEAAANRANEVDAAIVARGLGRSHIIALGRCFSKRAGTDGEWWPQGLQRTCTEEERKKARLAINEWADGEAIAAHAGYGNHYFCTEDQGRDLKTEAVLHASNQVWLHGTYGIKIITITELARLLSVGGHV
jgi:hypothetical protein